MSHARSASGGCQPMGVKATRFDPRIGAGIAEPETRQYEKPYSWSRQGSLDPSRSAITPPPSSRLPRRAHSHHHGQYLGRRPASPASGRFGSIYRLQALTKYCGGPNFRRPFGGAVNDKHAGMAGRLEALSRTGASALVGRTTPICAWRGLRTLKTRVKGARGCWAPECALAGRPAPKCPEVAANLPCLHLPTTLLWRRPTSPGSETAVPARAQPCAGGWQMERFSRHLHLFRDGILMGWS